MVNLVSLLPIRHDIAHRGFDVRRVVFQQFQSVFTVGLVRERRHFLGVVVKHAKPVQHVFGNASPIALGDDLRPKPFPIRATGARRFHHRPQFIVHGVIEGELRLQHRAFNSLPAFDGFAHRLSPV